MSSTLDKLFAMFLNGTEKESDVAYEKLCKAGVKLDQVAHRDEHGDWQANHGEQKFDIEPDKRRTA